MKEQTRYPNPESKNEEGPTIEEAAELRMKLYEYVGELIVDVDKDDPMADTLMDFIKAERDEWISKLPEGHPHRDLLNNN